MQCTSWVEVTILKQVCREVGDYYHLPVPQIHVDMSYVHGVVLTIIIVAIMYTMNFDIQ